MSMVFPGVADVMANPLRLVSMLMRLDLPTFDRPMNAYSGSVPAGHFLTSELLMINSALVIFMFCNVHRCNSCKDNTYFRKTFPLCRFLFIFARQ